MGAGQEVGCRLGLPAKAATRAVESLGLTELPVKLGDRKIARRSWETSEVITPNGNADFLFDP